MKVVCIKKGAPLTWDGSIVGKDGFGPAENEICEVYQSNVYRDHYVVFGYEYNPKGFWTHFNKKHFAPISDYLKEQTESTVKKITEEIKIEVPQTQEL